MIGLNLRDVLILLLDDEPDLKREVLLRALRTLNGSMYSEVSVTSEQAAD
jgi:hypothetical protein